MECSGGSGKSKSSGVGALPIIPSQPDASHRARLSASTGFGGT